MTILSKVMAACHEPGTVLAARNAEESLISSVESQTDPGTKKALRAAPNAKLWTAYWAITTSSCISASRPLAKLEDG